MKHAIIRTIIFLAAILLLEFLLGYFSASAQGASYDFSPRRKWLIPVFTVIYFIIQLMKQKRMNNL